MSDKQIKIPLELLIDVLRLTWQLDDENYDVKLKNAIQEQIDAKLNAMQKREQFTKYKIAPAGSNEREQARQEYLKLTKIKENHISQNEQI